MHKSIWNIYKIFFKIGTILLGGGYVILPLLQSEICEKRNWLTIDELTEYYAISQSLPGIIAANISIFTGYKLLKTRGAIAAILGVVAPAFIAIILIANILLEIVQHKTVGFLFSGVGIGVIILALLTVKEMWGKSIIDKFSFIIFLLATLLSIIKISPAIIVIICIIAGILYRSIWPETNNGEKL